MLDEQHDEPPPKETPTGREAPSAPSSSFAVEANTNEELPPGFWDDDPLPPPQRHVPADFPEAQDEHSQDSFSGHEVAVTPQVTPSRQEAGDIEAHPLFSELRALFPGRIVEKQAGGNGDESDATEEPPQDAIELIEDQTEREFDEAN